MSAAINHVRLLAPEDFFTPIVLVMKALGSPRRDTLEQEFRKGAARRAYLRKNNGIDDRDNEIVEGTIVNIDFIAASRHG